MSNPGASTVYIEGKGALLAGPKLGLSQDQKSAALSSFAMSALVGIIPFSFLLRRFGVRFAFLVPGSVSTLATFLTPLAVSRGGFAWLLVCRVLSGFAYSSVWPTVGAVAATWAPLTETGLWMGLLASCTQLSPVFTNSIAGELCETSMGWPSLYYVHGGCSALFLLLWSLVYRNAPEDHPFIDAGELSRISKGKAKVAKKKRTIPWNGILKSRAVWALFVTTFGNMCGIQFLVYYTPLYLKVRRRDHREHRTHSISIIIDLQTALNFDVRSSGFLSALPSLLMFLWKMSAGAISDWIRFERFTIAS